MSGGSMEDHEHEHFKCPTHCFCQLSFEDLTKWARKKHCEGQSTIDLLCSTDDPHEREIISAVALLDVDEATMLKMMGDVDKPEHHIIHCMESLKKIVEKECRL